VAELERLVSELGARRKEYAVVGGEEEAHTVLDEERDIGTERRVGAIGERAEVVGERVDGSGCGVNGNAV
jgi:hypothetical protein